MKPSDRFKDVLNEVEVVAARLADDGVYPDNPRLPLLVYEGAVALPAQDPAATFEALFAAHGWDGSWRNGVYRFHHYHSTAHEVLGVYGGEAEVQLGGSEGIVQRVRRGDVVVIPTGVAHKNLGATPDFCVVGAYPRGQRPDMCTGEEGERRRTDRNIARVARPEMDPVYGAGGPLLAQWTDG